MTLAAILVPGLWRQFPFSRHAQRPPWGPRFVPVPGSGPRAWGEGSLLRLLLVQHGAGARSRRQAEAGNGDNREPGGPSQEWTIPASEGHAGWGLDLGLCKEG